MRVPALIEDNQQPNLLGFVSASPFPLSGPVLLSRMKISKGLKQAYDLQDFAYSAALALRESLLKDGKLVILRSQAREEASAICSLVKAWESCQERIRIHRNKPMPGVLKPEKPQRKKARLPALVEGNVTPPNASVPSQLQTESKAA